MLRDLSSGLLQFVAPKSGAKEPGVQEPIPVPGAQSGAVPVTDGRPAEELGLGELLAEDFATHDRELLQPGFWAVAAHRVGRRAGNVELRAARLALEAAYKDAYTGIDRICGINKNRSED